MSRQKNFLTWIFSKNKKPYYVDANNLVMEGDVNTHKKADGQLAHLKSAPTGWKGTQVKFGRNTNYWGIFRDFTTSLQFGLDGARILKNIIWNDGYEAQAFFALHKINRYTWPASYDQWYMGELDFTKFKQSKSTADITVLDGGLAKYLKANESTTYELSLLDSQAVQVYLDGFPFTNNAEWTVFDEQYDIVPFNVGMGIIVQEGTSQGVVISDQEYSISNVIPNYFFRSYTKALIVNVSGSINVYHNSSGTGVVQIIKRRVVNNVAVSTTNYIIHTGSYPSGSQSYTVNFNIPVQADDRLYLMGQYMNIKQSTLKINYDVTFAPTFCRALKLKRIAELLVEKMTGNRYQCTSAFLDAIDDIVYTSGTGLRDYFDYDAVIKISFADFYKSLKGFDYVNRSGVGVGIENDNLVIENLLHFFQVAPVLDLGIIDNLSINVAQDLIYNTIKVGYANQTYDKVNGLDEVNVTQKYTTDVLKVVKELDLVDPVRADATGIEITRIDLNGKDTTDSKSDNDTFKISVKKGGTLNFYTGNFTVTANTFDIPDGDNRIPDLPVGTIITVSGGTAIDGSYTINNPNFIIPPHYFITVAGSIAAGSYNGSISYVSTSTYIPKRLTYSAISGILQPERKYNIEFSPKRMLLNQGGQLHSFLEAGNIHFQTGEKNSNLSTTYLGETIVEKGDLEVGNLAAKLWLPYYAEFDCEVPLTFKALMDLNPYGQISFQHGGFKFYGYLFDGSITPATNDIQKFKLLLAPNNNLKNFIN